jgi:cysteine-rich repeat protein
VTASLVQSGGPIWQPWVMPNADPTGFHGGYDADPGTDAHDTFHDIADMMGTIYYGSTGWYVDLTFTGLDPAEVYTFATSSSRANQTYTDRVTQYTLIGADTFTNASTTGVTEVTPDQVYFNTGDNISEGYVARWTGVSAVDGSFTVRAEAHSSAADGGRKAYAFDVFMLKLVGGPAPFCGDGNVDPGEQCDDGNGTPGDGCEADCTVTLPPVPALGGWAVLALVVALIGASAITVSRPARAR